LPCKAQARGAVVRRASDPLLSRLGAPGILGSTMAHDRAFDVPLPTGAWLRR